ncbi:glycoside hydrolase family 25 protein [Erythrobacter mangrovi]|uniref:Glycoside hydrolase family 25 protein n=2 Tax=Erythrobacter mangrovi TaxID=2739433 RepID=A0A7D3XJZ7_9SPHN|nr:glycoside hydrolase family 25 protein [Erythrobacter mangrovi]
MARRKRSRRRPFRLSRGMKMGLFLLLLIGVAAVYAAYEGRSWRPDESVWPDQGALVSAADGPVAFDTLHGLGGKFVYLEASEGSTGHDIGFAQNMVRARAAGLEVGAVHRFDPCQAADGQSANFVTMVPRDRDLLPPAILLEDTTEHCAEHVSKAAVQSELITLVNQIEAHTGKPVILAPIEEFEAAYGVSQRIDRQLWLTRSWFEPDYAARPWLMWTANRWYKSEAAGQPLRWVVVRPL